MQDPPAPAPDAPPPVPRHGSPRRGAAVPRMETVRLTAPDLARRAMLETARARMRTMVVGFCALFLVLAGRLAVVTIIAPHLPPPARGEDHVPKLAGPGSDLAPSDQRAMITDRHGQILAVSLPTADVFADPREMIDPDRTAAELKKALPDLDEKAIAARLRSGKSFVYIAREVSPRTEVAIDRMGIPGIYFHTTARRHYPLGRVAAQILGGVNVDQHGIAGVELAFDHRLRDDPTQPLRLSLDVRVQAVVRDELEQAMTTFQALGGVGIVMNADTDEVLAMVSLPDYDANDFGSAPANARFNRAVTGIYEPGSTFKLQTVSMALQEGVIHVWDQFDAIHPIHIGRFTITDYDPENRMLALPEVLAYSSNLGASHIALDVGEVRQRAWLKAMGLLSRVPIQLPEASPPLYPPVNNWHAAATMTIGFGQGIAEPPLNIVRGVGAIVDGGVLRKPTLLALPDGAPLPVGKRMMSPEVSRTMCQLMRLVVTKGTGQPANVPGYFVGGKTGTAEVVGRDGYRKHTNISSFVAAFPINAPRYVIYMMLDSPHPTAATHGFTTANWVVVPAASKVIARIGPMLGIYPVTGPAADQIEAELAMPLRPVRPPGAPVAQVVKIGEKLPLPRRIPTRMPPLHTQRGPGQRLNHASAHRQETRAAPLPDQAGGLHGVKLADR